MLFLELFLVFFYCAYVCAMRFWFFYDSWVCCDKEPKRSSIRHIKTTLAWNLLDYNIYNVHSFVWMCVRNYECNVSRVEPCLKTSRQWRAFEANVSFKSSSMYKYAVNTNLNDLHNARHARLYYLLLNKEWNIFLHIEINNFSLCEFLNLLHVRINVNRA